MEDDDFLLEFGVPPNPFSVRPAIQNIIEEANELQVRDAFNAALPKARTSAESFRCVVCTLPGGTCEHTDQWCILQSNRLLDATERSGVTSGSMDNIDAQLSDLVDVIGIASTNLPPSKQGRLTPQNDDEEDEEDEVSDNEINEMQNDSRNQSRGRTADSSASNQYEKHRLDKANNLINGGVALSQEMEPWEVTCAAGGTSSGLTAPPPLRTYRWTFPEQNADDRIGTAVVDLSSPSGRGGHTLVSCDAHTLIAFGGYSCETAQLDKPPMPFKDFSTSLNGTKVNYFDSLNIYDTVTQAWKNLHPAVINNELNEDQKGPRGRFGHCSVWLSRDTNQRPTSPTTEKKMKERFGLSEDLVLPDEPIIEGGVMFTFGGRLSGGMCTNEVWFLHWTNGRALWEFVGPSPAMSKQQEMNATAKDSAALLGLTSRNMSLDYRAWPCARYDAACSVCKGNRYVALHGGRNTEGANFGDLWLFSVASRHWEQPMMVGVPASPRYGHSLTVLDTEGEELLLLGGCTVSVAAAGLSEEMEDLQMELSMAAQRVARAYEMEVATARVAAASLKADALATGHINIQTAWRGMVRDGAVVAAAMASREKDSRYEEEALRSLLFDDAAAQRWTEITGSNAYNQQYSDTSYRTLSNEAREGAYRGAAAAEGEGGGGHTFDESTAASLHDAALNGSMGQGMFNGTATEFEKGMRMPKHRKRGNGMDGVVLDLRARVFFPLEAKGIAPPMRSHAVVSAVNGRIVVVGGQRPRDYAALKAGRDIEMVDSAESEVYVLDTLDAWPLRGVRSMKTGRWRWVKMPPEQSPKWLESAALAAEAKVRRSARSVEDHKARCLMQGHGQDEGLREAELVLKVSEWRARAVRRDQRGLEQPPKGRASPAFCTHGYRVFIHGGFTEHEALTEYLAIDLELADERQRRLKDEFAVRLERVVKESAAKTAMDDRERKFKEHLFAARNRHARECETAAMEIEDRRSSLPALTTAPQPACIASSAHTLWLQWPPVEFDALDRALPQPPKPTAVAISGDPPATPLLMGGRNRFEREGPPRIPHYYLSMRGGFSNIKVGQRVSVAFVLSKPKRRGRGSDTGIIQEKVEEVVPESKAPDRPDPTAKLPRFFGTCVRLHGDKDVGHFDVIYDDGSKDYRIPRWRIQPEDPGPWQLLYAGPGTSYEVQGIVPDFALAMEPKTAARCEFSLRTQFTEYTWSDQLGHRVRGDDLSLPSPPVTYSTRELDEEERAHLKFKATTEAAAARGKKSRKFKEAILLDSGVTIQVNGPGEVTADRGVNHDII